ncbi:MAG: hypothetical protein U9R26_03145 [Campylobacterota bacterium]|nr:hypothetical protein [Campylobacterota bacterium]
MELKYVGARPIVSQHGVSFDQTQPDSYTFLNAAIELLEALSFDTTGGGKVYLSNLSGKDYNGRQLADMLKKHCVDEADVFASREEKTSAMVNKYTDQVKENDRITADERGAWLGNIKIMRDYYLQYVTNENAYRCALNALADQLDSLHIDEVTLAAGRNYGLVLSHLIPVLTHHRPPYDATLSVDDKDGAVVVTLDMNRSKALGV